MSESALSLALECDPSLALSLFNRASLCCALPWPTGHGALHLVCLTNALARLSNHIWSVAFCDIPLGCIQCGVSQRKQERLFPASMGLQ